MKAFIKQSLLLGSFYFLLAYAVEYFAAKYAFVLSLALFGLLLLMVAILIFKKSFRFLDAFWLKFPKISLYLAALGTAKYFSLLFGGIPGALDGFLFSMAENNNEVYCSLFGPFLLLFITLYWLVFWIALFMATYLSFIKPKTAETN